MSEVKSAKELAEMMPLRNESVSTLDERNINYVADLIQSDRHSIIDKCKEVIHEEAKLYSPNVMKFDYSYCWAILDSVLSEIEKEE